MTKDKMNFWENIGIDGIEPYGNKRKEFYRQTEILLQKIFKDYKLVPFWVLDVGSGTGRWIMWYDTYHLVPIIRAVEPVKKWHSYYPAVITYESIFDIEGGYDLINAIGVMHHIIPDELRIKSVEKLLQHLTPNGLLIISGKFGIFPSWHTYQGQLYKVCWTKRKWKKVLKGYEVKFYKNKKRFYHHNLMVVRQHL